MTKYRINDICYSNKLNVKGISKDVPIRYLDTSSLTDGTVSEYQNFILKDAPCRAQRLLEHDTIVYSMVRPNLCHYGYFERPDNDIVVSTGFITLSLNPKYGLLIDMKYLYLLLTQPKMTQYLHSIAQNAVSSYPSLVPSDIENLVFDFPNYRKQLEISSIFFNIDRKIALNREINRNLPLAA